MAQSEVATAVESIVHHLVDQPECVQLTELEDGTVRLLTLRASGKQAGMVIGRKGRLINALRELVSAIASRRGEVIKIEVIAVPLLLLVALAAPAFSQDPAQAKPPVDGKEATTSSAQTVKSVETPKPVAMPAEIRELVEVQSVLQKEMARIAEASGDVKIPTPVRELQRLLGALDARVVAWLDAQKIPRDWNEKGWQFRDWTFTPPAEKKSETKQEEPK